MSAITIQQKVAEEIKGSGPTVEKLVIDSLANIEINKRKEAIIAALSKLKGLQAEGKKLAKPDVKTHIPMADGSFAVQEAFSDDAKKKIDEQVKKVKSLEDTLNAALEKNDGDSYGKLYELTK